MNDKDPGAPNPGVAGGATAHAESPAVVTAGAAGSVPAIHEIAPPADKVRARFIVPFALAQFGLFVALLGPVLISMAIKVTSLVGEEDAPGVTGLVLGVGAIAALLGNPVFGRLSDRTTSRWGRRRPWMVWGSIALALCMLVIAIAPNVPVVVIAWFVGQLAANACFAAYLATIADQVPPSQTATVSALGGLMQQIAILAAVGLATVFTANLIGLFVVPSVIAVVAMLIYALVLPDRQLHHRPSAPLLRTLLETFWVHPRRNPDFAWTWISRFLLMLGMFMFISFRLFWVKDKLGLDDAQGTQTIFVGVLIYTVVLVVVGQTAGYVSDRTGRRKLLVFLSTTLLAIGLALLIQVDSVTGFYVVEAIHGAAFGTYIGVDLALVLAVLPDRGDTAKDLGVFNIANTAPQVVAPLIGTVLLSVGAGHNYTVLYVGAAVLTFLGALSIIPVKGVR